MFLFLSKLLPLLFYPIGFSLLLLIIGLVALRRKQQRWAWGSILAASLVLYFSSTSLLSGALLRSLEWQNLPTALPPADAIVVLGGATRSPRPPRLGPEVTESGDRMIYATKLYREGKAPKIILSGGRITWQDASASKGGDSEADDMATLIEFMGVPASALLKDPSSLNTRQNAINVQKIMQEQNIKTILLVTSGFHMPRSLLIFRKLGINAIPAPVDFRTERDDPAANTSEGKLLSLLPDVENLFTTTYCIKEYVGIWVYRLRGWA
jgi:uncharacterized SAM-binding protein YcdF (DUF218 family)